MYYDLRSGSYVKEKNNKSLKFLYNTILGRLLLRIVITKFVSNLYSRYMNSKFSKHKIKRFIKKNNINMNEYEKKDYNSFNDFFIRNIKVNLRKIEGGIISPCDAKLTIYKVNKDLKLKIKNSIYTVEELIKEKQNYKYALVFRLDVCDYHHYIYMDDGNVISNKVIDGVFHTVQPIALKKYKVFMENSREVTFLKCKNLGNICYIEVGALMVGKICNEKKEIFKKGEEKGHFEFGGSTIIVLINSDVKFNKKIIENSKKEIETIVKMGQNIGW